MKILGISGSPIKDSNTDRALQRVLDATGQRSQFIKLSDYTIEHCNACLGCIETNQCVLNDEGVMLAEMAYKADALVVAGFTPYSSLDSRTKTFLERLYPLRHRHGLMAQKPGAAIITSAIPQDNANMPPASQNGLDAIKHYMMEEGMNYIGGVTIPGNVPCVRCGDAGQCQMSGIKMIHGQDATVANVGINNIDENPELLAKLDTLGEDLVKAYFTEMP